MTAIISALYLPESPRWLLAHGRVQEAIEIVRKAAKMNGIEMQPFTLVHREQLARSRFSSAANSFSCDDSKAVFPLSVPISLTASFINLNWSPSNSPKDSSPNLTTSKVGERTPLVFPVKNNNNVEMELLYSRNQNERKEKENDRVRAQSVSDVAAKNDFSDEKESENYLDLVRTHDIRCITIPLWVVWFTSGFAYYGMILFVARLYSTTTNDEHSCSFNYSSIFINASAEVD